jgi:hypothetical protein
MEIIMRKMLYIAMIVGFCNGLVGDLFAMEAQQSLNLLNKSIFTLQLLSKLEQGLQTKIWFAEKRPSEKELLQPVLSEVCEIKDAIVTGILEGSQFSTMAVALLPPNKKIDTLSSPQKEALVMFISQLNGEGNIISSSDSFFLAGALNILAEEDNPVSKHILAQMLKKTPKDFLEGSEF